MEGTAYDFRVARPVRDTVLDDAFGDLARDAERYGDRRGARPGDRPRRGAVGRPPPPVADGLQRRRPAGDAPRRSLAVEPMTAPPDAFRTGRDLVTLAPAGEPGDEVSVSWGDPGAAS